jgi:hypothetical protein
MLVGSPRRFAVVGGVFAMAALGSVQAAGGHPFPHWSGTSGPYSWEAKRLACGVVGEKPSRVRAHTRWRTSPANGYMRVAFRRLILNEETDEWTIVQRRSRTTRNTRLEGTRNVVHWFQWFQPFEDEAGKTSRHRVHLEWLRDRRGADPRLFNRWMTMRRCTVGG